MLLTFDAGPDGVVDDITFEALSVPDVDEDVLAVAGLLK